MYVAIYGYDNNNNLREHLGNITNVKITNTERVYDFSSSEIEGYCDFDMIDSLIYVVNTRSGKYIGSGFIKNIRKIGDKKIKFTGDDFKRILDTDILVDFTGDSYQDYKLDTLFNKIVNSIVAANRDGFMSKVPLNFIIANDTTDVREVANYTGQYLIVNALKFLKVYLAYYGYYIKPHYDVSNDLITFTFIKMKHDNLTEIKLKDFKHEKVSNDIKLNKAVATIAFTPTELPPEWEPSSSAYYNSQTTNNKATIDEGDNLPSTEGYPPGFALKVATAGVIEWVEATKSDYDNARVRLLRSVNINENYCRPASIQESLVAVENPQNYDPETVVRVTSVITDFDGNPVLCSTHAYIKIRISGTSYSYYKLGTMSYTKRPNLPERVYLLGKDNRIYEGYESISEENRLYPIVSKIFEAKYLSEAQINAVYELVNNRYIENILINVENTDQPINLDKLELYSMIRVYDESGDSKDIPISEKVTIFEKGGSKTILKLGFKKTLLTEVIKNDIGESDLIKRTGGSGGSGSNIVEEKFDVWTGDEAPNPQNYNTWFKPLSEIGETRMISSEPDIELSVIVQHHDEVEELQLTYTFDSERSRENMKDDISPELKIEEDLLE